MRRSWKLEIGSLIFLFLFIIHYSLFIIPVKAADASPSSFIQSKLDELKKEIASKAAAIKQEVNQNLQNKAFVGIIKTKSSSSLTVASKSGSKIINTNQDTVYSGTTTIGKSTKKVPVTFDNLKEEDYLAALGDIDDTGVLTAKKIILLPATSNQKPKTHLWGEVISISSQTITVTDKDSKNKTVLVSSDTDYKSGIDDASFSDIGKGDSIIVSGYLNDNQSLNAGLVYIIPQGPQTPKPTQTASASATPKASKSPSPKPTTK